MNRTGKRAKGFRADFWFFTKVIIFFLLFVFLVYPFSSLIIRAFQAKGSDSFSVANFVRFFTKKYYYSSLLNSLYIAFVPTVICTLIGVPMAYLMTRYNVAGKKAIDIFITMSLLSPPFIGAYSWIMLFGRSGFVTKLVLQLFGWHMPSIYGQLGIISVFVFKLYPYSYMYTSGALSTIDSSLEEAGENLGSSPLRRILTVSLPVVMPSIAAGALMVFMTALGDFGTPQMIGEGYRVLANLIYNEYLNETGGNAYMASCLSIILVVVALGILLFQKFYINKKNYVMSSMRPPKEIEVHGWKRFLISFPIWLVVFISLLPQITVTVCSFLPWNFTHFERGFTFKNYVDIFNQLGTNIKNTYLFSTVAIIGIVILGLLISYVIAKQKGWAGSVMDLLVMFPYVIPGSVLGICLIIAFNKKPLILTGTGLIMIISFIVRKLPFTVRSGSAYLEQMDSSIDEASISLGVSPMKTFFTITSRLMLPGLLSGAILSWIACINELSSSIMLYTGTTSTIAITVYTETFRNGHNTAAAMATILTFSTALALGIFKRLSRGKVSVV